MEEIILNMINQAENEENYLLIGYVKQLIDSFSSTINCPSNWQSIGSTLEKAYSEDDWTYEELELWNHVDLL